MLILYTKFWFPIKCCNTVSSFSRYHKRNSWQIILRLRSSRYLLSTYVCLYFQTTPLMKKNSHLPKYTLTQSHVMIPFFDRAKASKRPLSLEDPEKTNQIEVVNGSDNQLRWNDPFYQYKYPSLDQGWPNVKRIECSVPCKNKISLKATTT